MFTLDEILEGTQGRLDDASVAIPGHGFTRVVIDSRGSISGALFVALKGERVDGHSYVLDAARHGAIGALVSDRWEAPAAVPAGLALIRVDDPLAALQRLAGWWRARHEVQVIGVTGSVGKTSTKEALASILSSRFPTLKSEGNLNNEIGLPLTLLQLDDVHSKAVLEMGAGYALGELALLCEIARPEIAIVTHVLAVHASRLGTLEKIAQNKSELVRALPASGTAVLNCDNSLVSEMRHLTAATSICYGVEGDVDLQASDIESHGLEGVHFTMRYRPDGGEWRVRLPLLGRHSVHTALAAAGAAHAAGMQWPDIVAALQNLDASVRLLVVPGYNGSTIIDDSYNAAPESMIAALNLLEEMPGSRIAVLGDMLELGDYEREGHLTVARWASIVAHTLIVVGSLGRLMGEEALRAGMAPERVFFASDNEQAVDYLRSTLKSGDYVLVKGSRGLRMDRIADALKA